MLEKDDLKSYLTVAMKQSDAYYKALANFMFRELIEDAHAKYNISDEDMKDMCKKAVNRAMFYVNSQRSGDKAKMDAFLIYILSDSWYKEFIKELKALIDKYLKKHDSITE